MLPQSVQTLIRQQLNIEREMPEWRQAEIDHEFRVIARAVRLYKKIILQDSIISLDWKEGFQSMGYGVREEMQDNGYPCTIIELSDGAPG